MYGNLPREFQPLSPWAYFGLGILYALPLVGWIFLICHAIGASNINKRNYARSYFCVYILVILAVVIAALSGVSLSELGRASQMG